MWTQISAEDRARAIGTIGFEAVTTVGTGGVAAVVKTGGKAATVVKIVKGAKTVSRITSALDKTADAGRMAKMVNRISDLGIPGKTAGKIDDVIAAFRSQLNPIGPRLAPAMGVMDDAGDTGAVSKLYNDLIKKVEIKQAKKGVKINKTADTADDIGDAGRRAKSSSFKGTLKGKEIELPNVSTKQVTYTKRNPAECTQLRNKFNSNVRSEFLKDFIGQNADKLKELGFTDVDIAKLSDGLVPKGYQVHHKLPLDDGGTNDFGSSVFSRKGG